MKNRIYFSASINNHPSYIHTWNLAKKIIKLFGYNTIETRMDYFIEDQIFKSDDGDIIINKANISEPYPLFKFFSLTISRYTVAKYLNPDDILIITDGDLITLDPNYVIDSFVNSGVSKDKICYTELYPNRKFHICATYIIGLAKNFINLIPQDVMECIEMASNYCNGTSRNIYTEEHYLSELFSNNLDKVHFLNLKLNTENIFDLPITEIGMNEIDFSKYHQLHSFQDQGYVGFSQLKLLEKALSKYYEGLLEFKSSIETNYQYDYDIKKN